MNYYKLSGLLLTCIRDSSTIEDLCIIYQELEKIYGQLTPGEQKIFKDMSHAQELEWKKKYLKYKLKYLKLKKLKLCL